MAAYDDLNVRRIAMISVISVSVTAVSVLAVQVLYFAMADAVDARKSAASQYSRQNQILADQTAEVSRFGVDPETGNVTVPVEQVMQKMSQSEGAAEVPSDEST